MRTTGLTCAAACLLFAAVAAYVSETAKQEKVDPITALVQQLGDDDFEKREEASKKLEALGEKALPALVKGMASKDLEISRRCRTIVLRVMPKGTKSKATGMGFVRVVAGTFSMGSPLKEKDRRADETQHTVKLNKSFFLAANEVTQEEYEKVMKHNPSWFSKNGEGKDKVQGRSTAKFPVENVTWFDAIEFCNQLSKLDGYEPYYKIANVKRIGKSITAATVTRVGGNGYRLPTEAEWEFACRANTTLAFSFGVEIRAGQANLKPITISIGYGSGPKWQEVGRTTAVGNYPANPWGLYDMHGNVAEWCWDYYDKDYYDNSPAEDPMGPDKGKHRVLRGGSWLVTEGSGRSASRMFHGPDEKKYYTGFRVARNP